MANFRLAPLRFEIAGTGKRNENREAWIVSERSGASSDPTKRPRVLDTVPELAYPASLGTLRR